MNVNAARAGTVMNTRSLAYTGRLRRCATIMPRNFDHRRPLRHHRNRWRRQRAKLTGGIDDIATYHGQYRLNPFDLFFRYAEVVLTQNGEVRQLIGFDLTFFPLFTGEPGAALSPQQQGSIAIETRAVIVHRHAADSTPGNQPVESRPPMRLTSH